MKGGVILIKLAQGLSRYTTKRILVGCLCVVLLLVCGIGQRQKPAKSNTPRVAGQFTIGKAGFPAVVTMPAGDQRKTPVVPISWKDTLPYGPPSPGKTISPKGFEIRPAAAIEEVTGSFTQPSTIDVLYIQAARLKDAKSADSPSACLVEVVGSHLSIS